MAARQALIGTAGWSLPLAEQPRFPEGASHLERYAHVFRAVEINSTFHRPHRASTFERWARTVPASFRFSIKIPKAITHGQKLRDARAALEAFVDGLSPLGDRAACLLVQLPPSLAFEAAVAGDFLGALRAVFSRDVALEPRHASWFEGAADALLVEHRVARVAADPPRAANGGDPAGWTGIAYFRLHGSPRVYYSSYDDAFLEALAAKIASLPKRCARCWCIFDNTTLGAGTGNALALMERLRA